MPRVTFSATPVVCISIEGEPKGTSGFFEDDGLVIRFMKFMNRKRIRPCLKDGMQGGGRYVGYFTAEDAEVLKEWLIKEGVIQTDAD